MIVPNRLAVIPLGGLGEVGMNCMAFDCEGRVLIVDCGINFPGDDYGVDVVHPDFSWLFEHWERLEGVFLTHGHEDHIGGLPHLLRRGALPIWGPPHALRLVERRFEDHGLELPPGTLRPVYPRRSYVLGPFTVEPIRVSHSIVEATALAITTSAGVVVHSGDFKFDPAPPDGEPTDETRLLELGDAGVDLLLSDSTNVDSSGRSGSEADVAEALDSVVRNARRRVFVAMFSSNVQRLISLGKIARRRGRRLCLLGRSLSTHVQVARELGYLDWPHDLLLPVERLRSYPKAEVLVLATGTQAEPAAALAKLARGEHRWADVDPGDTVVFSSRIIPGCDRAVVQLMGDLLRRGASVESRWTAGVHASGHAHREEQQRMIELVRPAAFVPIHGTLHHLRRHAELARDAGVRQVRVVENGQTLVLEQRQLQLGPTVACGRVHVAIGGTELPLDVLSERRDLGKLGMLSLSLLCDERGQLCRHPSITSVGLPHLQSPECCEALCRDLETHWRALQRASNGRGQATPVRTAGESGERSAARSDRSSAWGVRFVGLATNQGGLAAAIERYVQRWADDRYGQRPLVAVHVQQLPKGQR